MRTFSFFVIGIFFFGMTAIFAEELKIEITSFRFADSRTRAAELCGIVTGADASLIVARIVSDVRTNAPAIYNTIVGGDGTFCATIVTFYGIAEVSAWMPGKETPSGGLTVSVFNQ